MTHGLSTPGLAPSNPEPEDDEVESVDSGWDGCSEPTTIPQLVEAIRQTCSIGEAIAKNVPGWVTLVRMRSPKHAGAALDWVFDAVLRADPSPQTPQLEGILETGLPTKLYIRYLYIQRIQLSTGLTI